MAVPTVFAQVMSIGHREIFRRCVSRYEGDAYIKSFSCHDQWLAMAFAQLTHRESLRDLESALGSRSELLYQMGFRGRVQRSTLADANEQRDWRIYADWAQALIRRARKLYVSEPFALDLDQTVYALDATVIDLCMTLFPWAHFRLSESAIKLHTLLDLRGSIPTFLTLTNATVNELLVLDTLPIEAGSIYVMDRGYTDFARLARFTAAGAFFVIRAKSGLDYYVAQSRPVDRSSGLGCDQTIRLRGRFTKQHYPAALRRVSYRDPRQDLPLVFLTNLVSVSALEITQLYRARWQIELFFRWIKQHLCIRRFVGNSQNAVRIQIWSAVSTYLLVAILKKTLKLEPSLHEILQVLSVTPFEKVPLLELFANRPLSFDTSVPASDIPNLFS
jgi:Transposase DDE domain/Domain of unknown function (DUF4372)